MSYILDALRKSEAERRQGRVPDLGQQVHLIHKPGKQSSLLAVWVGIGLVVNAAVLAWLLWPEPAAQATPAGQDSAVNETSSEIRPIATPAEEQSPEMSEPPPDVAQPEIPVQERPTIIVPSRNTAAYPTAGIPAGNTSGPVPHLVELPLDFQKSVPDLVFNSHIYASEPSSRRVMINNQYLKAGDVFSGMRVERITEEGVVLSKAGRSFRMGIVRDWVSPR